MGAFKVGICACHAAVAALVAGCGASPSSAFVPEDRGPTADGATDAPSLFTDLAADGGVVLNVLSSTGDASVYAATCSNAASAFVYVLSSANELYRFAPDRKTFGKVGTVACAPGQTPNSMAVDRNGIAWVNYLDGTLRPVSTDDASCKGTPIPLPAAWRQDGMAYVAASGSTSDALYLGGAQMSATAGLARADTATGTVTPVGPYSGALRGASAELTGTADGRLFGFFEKSPAELAQIDATSGAILSQTPLASLTLAPSSSFAFSFWGGRFYFYSYPNAGSLSTNVAAYDPTTGSLDPSFMIDIGFVIIGAGVSTCAPLVPPIPR